MIDRRCFSRAAISTVALTSLGLDPKRSVAEERYPSKLIRIIFPLGPGGGVEAVVRQIADKMTTRLGQSVILENKPGANTQLGVNFVAKSPPDGYTIGVGFITNLTLAPYVYKSIPYNPQKDLLPIAVFGTNYGALVTQPDAPFSNVKQMSEWARTRPNGLSVGTTSLGGFGHLAFEQLARMLPLPFTVVPYNGNGPLQQDVVGGRVDVGVVDFSGSAGLIETGRLKLLGTTSPARDPRFPQMPTIAETLPGYQALGWFGFIAPAGTPKAAIAALNQAINEALAASEVKESMAVLGLTPTPATADDFASLLKAEDQKYGELVKQIGFKPL